MSDPYKEARAAEAVLDRYREQRQKDLGKYIAELRSNRDSYMLRARWYGEQDKHNDARHCVRRAREYNHLAVKIQRDVRTLS